MELTKTETWKNGEKQLQHGGHYNIWVYTGREDYGSVSTMCNAVRPELVLNTFQPEDCSCLRERKIKTHTHTHTHQQKQEIRESQKQ